MKSSIKLIRVAQFDTYNNLDEILNQKNQERKNRSQRDSDDKAERYKLLKNKAEEMGISIADYIDHFGSFEDKQNFGNIAQQQSEVRQPEQTSTDFKDYNKVLEAFQFIKEKSEELNIPITRVWEDMQLPSEIKFKVHTLVVNYERLQKIEESREIQNNQQSDSSLEERLKRSTENARFYTEQWNQVIEDAEKQNIDPIVYISAHYPDDLAQQIIAWYKIKTGEINATNMEEYFAQSVEQLSDQEVQSFEQNYDDNAFQNFVDKAREIAENIDWEKAGAYLDEGKNRIIYQLLKPGSIIKKTTDAIKVVISMLSLNNVEEFNDQYYKDQEDRERAIQELDNYKLSKKMDKFQKLAQLKKDIELLENAGQIRAAEIMHQKFIKESQYMMPQMMPMMMMPQMMPQMMMARPQMPVARPVVNQTPTSAPTPVVAPTSVVAPTPVQQGQTGQTGQVTPPAQSTTPPTTQPPVVNPPVTTPPPMPIDKVKRQYGDGQSKNEELQYLDKEKRRLEELGYNDPKSPFYQQYLTIIGMINRNKGGSIIKKSENMNKLQKLAQLNKDIELLENAGKFKAAEILQKKLFKEAQTFGYGDTSSNFDAPGYSGPRQDMPDTYANVELNEQIRQNLRNNKQQNPSTQTSNPTESDTANVNAFNEGMYGQINPLSSTSQLDYKTLINQAKNYIASGDMNTAAQIKQQALNSSMTPQQKAAFQQQYNTIVQNYSNTANNPEAFQSQENAQNAIAKAAQSLGINTNDPQAIRKNELKLRSKLQQMGLLKDKNVQSLLRQISLSGYYIQNPNK
jgi:hypothetical protein